MNKAISIADFRLLSLRRILGFAKKYRIYIEDDGTFVKREPTPLLVYQSIENISEDINNILIEIEKIDPDQTPFTRSVAGVKSRTLEAKNSFQLVSTYYDLLGLESKYLRENFDLERKDEVRISVSSSDIRYEIIKASPELEYYKKESISHETFLLEAMRASERNRSKSRYPTLEESALVEVAQQSVIEGRNLPPYFQDLGTAGFREIQTYLSIADPGEGHESVIASRSDLLDGVVVHVEHIDRDKNADKDVVEPYRLPAAINAAKVRVAIGNEAPVTAFIGRPMFENFDSSIQLDPKFELDLLKSSHYTASACSTMFMLGIVDCKIGFERMTIEQAVKFAKAVVGNVIRDQDRQYLSAAFNLNTPLIDDSSKITDRFQIARAGIAIASEGGFNKVTWDGASSEIPSKPVIDQLTHKQLVTIIHEAHEKGLETYISAGLQADHMERCVITGVDGIGIGTSLHYRDPQTKLMGALKPEAIKLVLSNRDNAAKTSLGKGAKLLARLDREYFEQIISDENNHLRLNLFEHLKIKDVTSIEGLLSQYKSNYLSDETSHMHPLISQANRLATSQGSLLEKNIGKSEFMGLQQVLQSAARSADLATLRSYLKR